jgi:hypothetical protein
MTSLPAWERPRAIRNGSPADRLTIIYNRVPMRCTRIIPLLLALALTRQVRAAGQTFDVQLIEPAARVGLVAGSTASIAWEAVDMPADVEEWEAFLSIDGGATYPIRLTPHLDRTIHGFTWIVPSLPGSEVTILLRFGNEGEERQFSFAGRARIEGVASFDRLRYEAGHEESAVPEQDDHGETLVEWVEGSRDGSRLRRVVAGEPLMAGQNELAVPPDHETLAAVGRDSRRIDVVARRSTGSSHRLTRAIRSQRSIAGRHATDVLRLSGRLNI